MRICSVLTAASEGARIDPADALQIFLHAPLPDLGWAADRVCTRKHPGNVRSYVIDRNINYTNFCVSGCRFCAFYRSPEDRDGYLLSVEEIVRKVDEAVSLGATQILLQGGLNPDLRIEYFESLFSAIKQRYDVQLHSLSAPEIVHIARVSGLGIRQTIQRLKDAGLDSLPGGGAEILVDSVRSRVSPRKCSADEWVEVIRQAADIGLQATATMVFGLGESIADRIEHLGRIRALQDETGVFTAFIPWSYQPGNTELGGRAAGAHDYLRTLAISRLFLDNVRNLQVSWVTQGPRVAQLALRFGANDAGSTMIEENVVAAAGVTHRMSERELIAMIHAAGFDAAQRTTLYDVVRTHPRPAGKQGGQCIE